MLAVLFFGKSMKRYWSVDELCQKLYQHNLSKPETNNGFIISAYLFIYLFIHLFIYRFILFVYFVSCFFFISLLLQWNELTQPTKYQACDITYKQSDSKPSNWLISGRITVTEANRIDVTVEYLTRSCLKLSNNGGPYCVHVFDLYVNQSDQFIKYQSLYPNPLSNPMAYEKVAEIKQATEVRISETISIRVKGKYAILAFRNYGACSTLFSVTVTYNVCPDETLSSSLMSVPRTVAPANDSQPVRVKANCTKGTVQISSSLHAHCESNGVWNTTGLKGRCICKEDMQNNDGICKGTLFLNLMEK